MATKRTKGRPAYGDGDLAGRERLILAARTMMKKRPRVDLPRRELAIAAGATPALVTYHFPTELALVEAAAKPIIDTYLDRLATLVSAKNDAGTIFRQLILLFLEISRDNGQLLDSYIDVVKNRAGGPSGGFLAAAYGQLAAFLERCESEAFIRQVDPAFCQILIWGVCKMVAQSQELADMILADLPDPAKLPERQADLIIDTIIVGLRRSPVRGSA